MGLAVTVSWSPVAKARDYVVHRGAGAFSPTPATQLRTVQGADDPLRGVPAGAPVE